MCLRHRARFLHSFINSTGKVMIFKKIFNYSIFLLFRSEYLDKKNRLVVLPENGFIKNNQNVSKICKIFLDYIEFSNGIQIDREVKIGRWKVDGVIEPLVDPIDNPLLKNLPLNKRVIVEIDGLIYVQSVRFYL